MSDSLTPRQILDDGIARGFRYLFWPRELGKGPQEKGWEQATESARPEDWHDGLNVGVLLGVEIQPGHFLLDVDFDWSEGGKMARHFLPDTGYGFGRKSRPVSHMFYTTSTSVPGRAFKDVDGQTLVELRGTTLDGMIGFQTMTCPSVHPSGEPLLLHRIGDGSIGHNDSVPQCVLHYAIACILLRNVAPRGFGHDVRMAAAGFLLKLRLAQEDVIRILQAVTEMTGNSTNEVESDVRYTHARIETRRGRVTGGKKLAEEIGERGAAVVKRIGEWLRDATEHGPDDVAMEGGKLTEIVDRAEDALLARGTPIYQRGGVLIRPVRLDHARGESVPIRRAAGAVVLASVRERWLLEQMGLVLRWFRGEAITDPQPKYALTLLERGEWRFPVLRGVVMAPTLDRDGRILEVPGFDRVSGLLVNVEPNVFPPVPLQPTKDQAAEALARLAHPLRAFPFVDDPARAGGSRAVALSALLTAVVRGSLRTAPLHGFDAPTAGTGKSLLAEMVGLLSMGVKTPAMSQGKTLEEDEKRLSTVLFAGDPVLHIDNCDRPITGDFLCSVLTQEVVQARILGKSERRVLPSTTLVLASGNNLTFAGDTSRRAVKCRLDARVERPDVREFDFDCHAELLATRPGLVVDALTVLRCYIVAGSPERLPAMGSFPDYDWIRGALVWLGEADPEITRKEILDADPKRDELLDVMRIWAAAVADEPIEVAQIDRAAEEEFAKRGQPRGVGEIEHGEKMIALRDTLLATACHGHWSTKSVGRWLARHRDRVLSDASFRSRENGHNPLKWWLEGAEHVKAEGDVRANVTRQPAAGNLPFELAISPDDF